MTQFASLPQLNLHYRLEGNPQGPTLVFINSLGSDLRIWDQAAAHFARHFRVLRYDKRGHGLSDAPGAPYTLREHTQDLKALLESLQISRVIVVGVSVGGLIAQDFALTYPQHTLAAVLCDTGAKIGNPEMWNARIAAIREQGLPEVAKTVIGRWFTSGFFEGRAAEAAGYFNMLSRTPLEGYIGTCEALRDADLRQAVGAIRVPALVVCGDSDQSTPPALGQELADALGVRLALIPNCGHLPCIEQPQMLNQILEAFLQEHGYVR